MPKSIKIKTWDLVATVTGYDADRQEFVGRLRSGAVVYVPAAQAEILPSNCNNVAT